MTLKQSQGHQIWYESLDPKSRKVIIKPSLTHKKKCVQEKVNIKVFVKTHQLSSSNIYEHPKQWYIHNLVDTINKLTNHLNIFNFTGYEVKLCCLEVWSWSLKAA